jgi:hypothetical protein
MAAAELWSVEGDERTDLIRVLANTKQARDQIDDVAAMLDVAVMLEAMEGLGYRIVPVDEDGRPRD